MRVGVIGAGTMGYGIAHVAAVAGDEVVLADVQPSVVEKGLAKVRENLGKGVQKGKVSAADAAAALGRLRGGTFAEAVTGADLVVEAVPERLDLKVAVFRDIASAAPPDCILATNTSSISIGKIGAALPEPGRLIGTHFFNPVHLMELLELVVSEHTRPDVLERTRAWGERLGKQVIVVRDIPGFATSRLGVLLGMEALRMLEQGVASAADLDKAMVLGYRHPIGPLALTDLVGLDVRLAIGESLARELGSAAFEPPPILRRLVAEGRLGKKVGKGIFEY
jgi:3-hydroxybutyryl-CoA dehydrogenase